MIRKLFDYDGPFLRFVSLLSRLSVISLLWLLLCLPVVTAGASSAGLFGAAEHLQKGNAGTVRAFFSAFRRHFRRATCMWFLSAVPLVLLATGFHALKENDVELPFVIIALTGTALLLLFFVNLWFYPVLCRFHGSFPELFLNALILALVHIPFTVLATLLFAGIGILTLRLGTAGIFMVPFAPGILAYGCLLLFDKPLTSYSTDGGRSA